MDGGLQGRLIAQSPRFYHNEEREIDMHPKIIRISKTIDAAVTFAHGWEQIDPRSARSANQAVTVCILRPLCKGPRETFVGVAVCSPREYSDWHIGETVALARAIQQLTGDPYRECHSRARRWFWEQDQEVKAAEAVAQMNAPVEA